MTSLTLVEFRNDTLSEELKELKQLIPKEHFLTMNTIHMCKLTLKKTEYRKIQIKFEFHEKWKSKFFFFFFFQKINENKN